MSALVGVIVGGLFVVAFGLYRIEYERGAELRSRQLDAADEFFQSFVESIEIGKQLWFQLVEAPGSLGESHPEFRRFKDSAATTGSRALRIAMLFPPESGVAQRVKWMVRDIDMLENGLATDAPTMKSEDIQVFRSAAEYQAEFTWQVFTLIDGRWWKTALRQLGKPLVRFHLKEESSPHDRGGPWQFRD